ncbi:Mitogen-activated protein kinase kinase 3 isoform 2 [Theobroma cacao]|uniref:mitogen-activated protein kinase kinase n=1 Tax=Theobroma cacao TaxID=3641 RepID=A0A061EC33_THECC|nr:Mitogen-activated protein kinase kinase 3 isoform 2 [Theobroma cacao]
MLSDSGTVNLLSRSYGVYNINELGLQKCTSSPVDESDQGEKTYRCASHEMRIFGAIGSGASSVVQRAMHIPSHRILALKKINIFEKEKRQQLLTEIRTLCEAPCSEGLVEFHGAFYTPDSGQISIALEYMDGGSLADILRLQKSIPEPVLSSMFQKLLQGLSYLHGVRHLVHRDIKPANLLVNLKGEPKITDFGISAGLDNSMAILFDGPDETWHHTRTLYNEDSTFSFSGKKFVGPNDIHAKLSNIRSTLLGDWPPEKLVHVVEKLQCRAHGQDGVAIRVSGSLIIGNQFLICGDGLQVEGMANFKDLAIDIPSKRMGKFQEQFIMEPRDLIGRYFIAKQELYIIQ